MAALCRVRGGLVAGVLALGACDRSDPELDPFAAVLVEAEGLGTRPPAEDLARVRRARAARDLPALASWEARLVAELEGLPAALAVLDTAIERFPKVPELRWDRAALRARAGQLADAAADLKGPVARGTLDPAALGRDPDLAALAADPRFAGLVQLPELRVAATAPPDGLVGDRWELELELAGPPGALVVAAAGPVPPAQLLSVVEDVLEEGALDTRRRLQWRARLTGPATGRVGPWTVRSGALEATAKALPLEVTALGAADPGGVGSGWPAELPVPSALRQGAELPVVATRGASLFLAAPAHHSLTLPPACVGIERRHQGRRDWHGALCPVGGGGAWSIADGDRTVQQGTL